MPDKRQIVFVSRALWGGGAERVVYDLAHHLNKEWFEVHIICLFQQQSIPVSFDPGISIHHLEPAVVQEPASPKPAKQGLKIGYKIRKKLYFLAKRIYHLVVPASIRMKLKLGERLYQIQTSGLSSSPGPGAFSIPAGMEDSEVSQMIQSITNIMPSIGRLQQVLGKFRNDAILLPVMEEATVRVWLSQLFEHRVYIASLHSIESYNMSLIYSDPRLRSIEEWLFTNACRAAHVVTVPSYGCRHDLSIHYGISPEHIEVIANPVDADAILRESESPLQLELDGQKTLFVYVGRLDPDKNPELLLDAAYLLKQRFSDFLIYYIGKGALYEELSSQIEEKGLQENVILVGEVPNPFPYMRRSRALILTSHVESFALVLVEAMLCGAVPVAVDCPYGPGEVLDDGKYGLLVPQDDPQALADAMWQIANDNDLYAKLRELGQERAHHYNISRIIDHWENLLSGVQANSFEEMSKIL